MESRHQVTRENGSCRVRRRNSAFLNFRYKNGGSERETLGHRVSPPGSQMAWGQNPGTCFFWRPHIWSAILFSSLCSKAWPLPTSVLAVPYTRASGQGGQEGAEILPSLLYKPCSWCKPHSSEKVLFLSCAKAPCGLAWPCSWESLPGWSSHPQMPA